MRRGPAVRTATDSCAPAKVESESLTWRSFGLNAPESLCLAGVYGRGE